MLQTSREIRKKRWEEMKGGSLFPYTRFFPLKLFERITLSLAFVPRVLLRKQIGSDSFSIFHLFTGFSCTRIATYIAQGTEFPYDSFADVLVLNPAQFEPDAFFLSVLSFLILGFGIFAKLRTIFNLHFLGIDVDIRNRGKSYFNFKKLENTKAQVFNKNWWKHCVVEASLIIGVGTSLTLWGGELLVIGIYFLVTGSAFLICEATYYFADGRLFADQRGGKISGEKWVNKHEQVESGGGGTLYDDLYN